MLNVKRDEMLMMLTDCMLKGTNVLNEYAKCAECKGR